MQQPVLVALIALGGALIGAILQSPLTRGVERSKFIRDNRRSAYQDFLVGVADLAIHPPASSEHAKAQAEVVEARCRIALFGTREVMPPIAALFENVSTLADPLAQHHFYEVILQMRRDCVGRLDYGIKVDLFSVVFSTAQEGK